MHTTILARALVPDTSSGVGFVDSFNRFYTSYLNDRALIADLIFFVAVAVFFLGCLKRETERYDEQAKMWIAKFRLALSRVALPMVVVVLATTWFGIKAGSWWRFHVIGLVWWAASPVRRFLYIHTALAIDRAVRIASEQEAILHEDFLRVGTLRAAYYYYGRGFYFRYGWSVWRKLLHVITFPTLWIGVAMVDLSYWPTVAALEVVCCAVIASRTPRRLQPIWAMR